jgi:hypothetical protein
MTTAEEIVDAEIVGEHRPRSGRSELAVRERIDMVVTRIQPAVATCRRQAPTLVRRGLRFVLVAITLDLLRGVRAWCAAWWRWKILATQTERAGTPGKGTGAIEDKLQERRDRRTVQSILGVLVLLIGLALFWWLAPVEYKRYALGVLLVGLFTAGHAWSRRVDAPADSRPPGYDGSIESIRRAFKGARITSKDQSVWITPGTRPERIGEGVQLSLDLDNGITWTKVAANKGGLGSGLQADSDFIVVQKGKHDGQAKLWFSEEDPFRHGHVRSPLLDVERWDSWKPAPFGRTPMGADLPMSLLYSNYLGGGLPGSGKSWTSRVPVAPFLLDPQARLFIANGKGDAAWEATRNSCQEYIRGSRVEDAWALVALLDKVIAEMEERYANSSASKVVPEDGLPPWLVAIDELQNYTTISDPAEQTVWGKKNATLGLLIVSKLAYIAKNARASAIILMALTQKPDNVSLPSALRDQFGTRFSNRVGNRHVSEMILGKSPVDGVDSSTLPSRHKGIGILVPDAELATGISGYPIVMPHTIDDMDWQRLGDRAYALRREAGTHGRMRGTEADAYPLPPLLERIHSHIAHLADEDRVASSELRLAYAPDMSEKAFGGQLRRWGAPTGRAPGNKGPSGPLVGDLRRVAQRIREGGKIESIQAA